MTLTLSIRNFPLWTWLEEKEERTIIEEKSKDKKTEEGDYATFLYASFQTWVRFKVWQEEKQWIEWKIDIFI